LAERRVQTAQVQLNLTDRELVAAIRRACAELLRLEEEELTAAEDLALTEQIRSRIGMSTRAGEVPRFDLTRAEGEVAIARKVLETTRLRRGQARFDLRRVLGWLEQEQPTEAVPFAQADLLSHGGDRKSSDFKASQARDDQLDNINLKGGTQAAYLDARLRRNFPEIAAALDRGEHRSVRAAAIAAGIVRPVPTVRLVGDPVKVAAAIRKHLDPQQVASLVEELQR
jgi:outer membrane protein TolC